MNLTQLLTQCKHRQLASLKNLEGPIYLIQGYQQKFWASRNLHKVFFHKPENRNCIVATIPQELFFEYATLLKPQERFTDSVLSDGSGQFNLLFSISFESISNHLNKDTSNESSQCPQTKDSGKI